MIKGRRKLKGFLLPLLVLGIVLVFLPLLGLEGYRLRLLSLIFMWVALSGCWNLMSGTTGYIDFGPVAYFGVGSYCTAILMIKGGLPFFLSLIIGGCICGILSLIVGLATLRLAGRLFCHCHLCSRGSPETDCPRGRSSVRHRFFWGGHGLTLPSAPPGVFFYYVMLFIMGGVVILAALIHKSKWGYGLRAIRDAEQAAELAGVPTFWIKVRVYILSSSLIGCIGGVEAYWLTYIIPDDVFNVMRTIQIIIMTLLGGMGTILGPVIGASFLTLISEYLGARFVYDYLIFVGMVIVAVILLMPRGIMGALAKKGRRSSWLY